MKITFSPLIAGMSGKAADAVASSWKGRPVIRKYVIPANPKTAAQVAQRAKFARMGRWFRSLPTEMKTWLNTVGNASRISGFNATSKTNLKALAAAAAPGITPAVSVINALQSLAGAAGVNTKEIDVTYVAGAAVATHYVHFFTCPVDPDEVGKVEPDLWTYHTGQIVLVSAAAATLTLFTADKSYYVAGIVMDTNAIATATKMAGGVTDEADSKV